MFRRGSLKIAQASTFRHEWVCGEPIVGAVLGFWHYTGNNGQKTGRGTVVCMSIPIA